MKRPYNSKTRRKWLELRYRVQIPTMSTERETVAKFEASSALPDMQTISNNQPRRPYRRIQTMTPEQVESALRVGAVWGGIIGGGLFTASSYFVPETPAPVLSLLVGGIVALDKINKMLGVFDLSNIEEIFEIDIDGDGIIGDAPKVKFDVMVTRGNNSQRYTGNWPLTIDQTDALHDLMEQNGGKWNRKEFKKVCPHDAYSKVNQYMVDMSGVVDNRMTPNGYTILRQMMGDY